MSRRKQVDMVPDASDELLAAAVLARAAALSSTLACHWHKLVESFGYRGVLDHVLMRALIDVEIPQSPEGSPKNGIEDFVDLAAEDVFEEWNFSQDDLTVRLAQAALLMHP